MTKLQEKYQKNQELMSNYINNHQELKLFINSFKEMQEASNEGRKTKLNISVGESKKEGFLLYLSSSVNNPRILFSSSEKKENDKIPQVIISDKSRLTTCFTLDNAHIISSKAENDDNACPFNKYNFVVHVTDKPDYDMAMVIYKK